MCENWSSIDPVLSFKFVHQLGVCFSILFKTRSLAASIVHTIHYLLIKFYDMLNYTSIV